MKFLFSHRNFPAQFRQILVELAKNPENEIVFITGTKNDVNIKGVKKLLYTPRREVPENCHRYLRQYEDSVIHGQAAAEVAIALKNCGFIPDVIYAHAWGNSMFFKDIFPNTPLIHFCEWYYNSKNSDIDFEKQTINDDLKALTRAKNAQMLIDIVSCDVGVSPTKWQKSQYPKEFQEKIKVLHDGIDTEYFRPDPNACLRIPDTNIMLTAKDEIVTYATRGMEPYRGFPQFMTMAEKLLKKRKNVHIVIGGEDRICYGPKLANSSYKEIMLKKLDLDMTRVHFTGGLPYGEYKKLLQISSAHVYLTYPFVLSWSMLEAMSCGCCIIGSKTAPVEEVITNGENGILTYFFDTDELLSKVEYVLDNPSEFEQIKQKARETIVKNYNVRILLPQILDVIYKTARQTDSLTP